MKEHNKHKKLKKPIGGYYHRVEFGFIGAPCDIIRNLCQSVIDQLSSKYQLAYLDADHHRDAQNATPFVSHVTDKIDYYRLDIPTGNSQAIRSGLNAVDAVLINANHFKADCQLVILHPKKMESLSRKLKKLTNVELLLMSREENEIYPFLQNHLGQDSDIPILNIDDTEGIAQFIERKMKASIAPLNGLVLCGGQSVRMGIDKGSINYHGKEQREYLADLITPFCEKTLMSVRQDQEFDTTYEKVVDTFDDLGPYGGVLSAFRCEPNMAYLSIPTDAPFINSQLIKELVDNRNPNKLATCFYNPDTEFPEPLISIWEPRSYPVLLQYLSMGYTCLRKVLINEDKHMIKTLFPEQLFNANTLNEMEIARSKISKLK